MLGLGGRGFYALRDSKMSAAPRPKRTPCCRRCRCGSGPRYRARSRESIVSRPRRCQPTWGSRILSKRSALYDPLSLHYGSVWPLFTGWSAVAAYRYRAASRRLHSGVEHAVSRPTNLRRLRDHVRPLVRRQLLVGRRWSWRPCSRGCSGSRRGRGRRHAPIRARPATWTAPPTCRWGRRDTRLSHRPGGQPTVQIAACRECRRAAEGLDTWCGRARRARRHARAPRGSASAARRQGDTPSEVGSGLLM